MSLVGMDIGSTGVKAVAFNPEGTILASAYREYPEILPRPNRVELDPNQVFSGILEVLNEVCEAVRDDPPRTLCMSTMGETFTPMDAEGNFLHNSIVSPDNRAIAQAESWAETLGFERVFEITGHSAHPSFTINKIMWIRDNMPDLHARTHKYLLWPDAVMMRLGIEPRIDYSLAARTMALDIRAKVWSDEMLTTAGIDASMLAEPIHSGSVAGEIGPRAAELTGLPVGCLVVAGGHDQPMNALGAGVTAEGMAVDGMGTVECITTAFDEPVTNDAMRESNYCVYPHVYGDMYVTLAYNYAAGDLLRWYRDNFAHPEMARAATEGLSVYDLITAGLPEGPTGVLVLPYLAGAATPYFDPRASGAILGLTLSADRKTIVKAILEGTCYEMMLNLKRLAAGGVHIDRLRCTGGGSKSPVWLQIKADITGLETVTLNVTESGSLAGAMLGGVAAGEFSNVIDAIDAIVHEQDSYQPDSEQHKLYEELFAIYDGAWPAIANLAHRLADE